PDWVDRQRRPGGAEGELGSLFRSAGLRDVQESILTAEVPLASFEDWWEPFLLGAGPAGDYVAGLSEEGRVDLEQRARRLFADGAFTLRVDAGCAIATVGGGQGGLSVLRSQRSVGRG